MRVCMLTAHYRYTSHKKVKIFLAWLKLCRIGVIFIIMSQKKTERKSIPRLTHIVIDF